MGDKDLAPFHNGIIAYARALYPSITKTAAFIGCSHSGVANGYSKYQENNTSTTKKQNCKDALMMIPQGELRIKWVIKKVKAPSKSQNVRSTSIYRNLIPTSIYIFDVVPRVQVIFSANGGITKYHIGCHKSVITQSTYYYKTQNLYMDLITINRKKVFEVHLDSYQSVENQITSAMNLKLIHPCDASHQIQWDLSCRRGKKKNYNTQMYLSWGKKTQETITVCINKQTNQIMLQYLHRIKYLTRKRTIWCSMTI